MKAGAICKLSTVGVTGLTANLGKRVKLIRETPFQHEWECEIMDPMVATDGKEYPAGTIGMFYLYNLTPETA